MSRDITLFHISDLHIFDRTLGLKELLRSHPITSKRVLGWFNHQLNRGGDHFQSETLERVFQYLYSTDFDYLIISGDVTTLALKNEFEMALRYFSPLIEKKPVLFIPGNHDRYSRNVVKPVDLMATIFKACFPFNQENFTRHGVPHLFVEDQAVIFCIDTSVPRSHLSSRGKVLTDLGELESFLSGLDNSIKKIAYGHYPIVTPAENTDGYLHKLAGRKRLAQLFKKYPIDLYLHGHIHKTWQFQSESYPGTTWINSGGCCRYSHGEWSGFHRITLNKSTIDLERVTLN